MAFITYNIKNILVSEQICVILFSKIVTEQTINARSTRELIKEKEKKDERKDLFVRRFYTNKKNQTPGEKRVLSSGTSDNLDLYGQKNAHTASFQKHRWTIYTKTRP